jgi:peroxiredoxin
MTALATSAAAVAVIGLSLSSVTAGDQTGVAAANSVPAAVTLAPGQKAPDFSLKDTEGKSHSLKQYIESGKTVVVHWFNPNCPFIVRHYEKYPTFVELEKKYRSDNVVFLAVNSTNPNHPQFGGDVENGKKWGVNYPILLDPAGEIGKLYGAKTTPHAFVITKDGVIRYAGAIDDDPQDERSSKDKVNYVKQALDELRAGKPVTIAESKPYGCSVKYAQ